MNYEELVRDLRNYGCITVDPLHTILEKAADVIEGRQGGRRMDDYISRGDLLAAYDREHAGPPGKARELIVNAPAADDWTASKPAISPEELKPLTNADCVRSMTDEALAAFMWDRNQGGCPPTKCKGDKCGAWECWLDWLKQEASP